MSNQNFIEQLAEKLRAIGSLKAVGDTWISFDSSVPPGGVPFCGQEVTRALYADLWTWAQAQGKVKTELEWQEHAMANGGNCPYYSSGNGSTTFRMPCVLGYMKGSSVTTEGGTYKPQKLPNVSGYVHLGGIYSVSGSEGALVESAQETGNNANHNTTDYYQGAAVKLNLNKGNDIYQDGADVQPETYQVLVGVYAVGVIQNINNTDVQQLQTGLATLEANVVKSVNGITPIAGNVTLPQINGTLIDSWISEDGLSFYRKYSDGWIEQGGRCGGGQPVTVALPLSFSSTNYRIVAVGCLSSTSDSYEQCSIYSKSLDSFKIAGRNASAREWLAVGF